MIGTAFQLFKTHQLILSVCHYVRAFTLALISAFAPSHLAHQRTQIRDFFHDDDDNNNNNNQPLLFCQQT
jgi:hypothetical protein